MAVEVLLLTVLLAVDSRQEPVLTKGVLRRYVCCCVVALKDVSERVVPSNLVVLITLTVRWAVLHDTRDKLVDRADGCWVGELLLILIAVVFHGLRHTVVVEPVARLEGVL